MELHKKKYWHILLHYKATLSGYNSYIDDPKFFLSKEGKSNPKKELQATIRAFFRPVIINENDHPICRFIARFHWLKKQLSIDVTKLPMTDCSRLNAIIEKVQPISTTLAFPTSHINSPASMFGHTLLIVETVQKSRLLSYSISYSAVTTETFGPLFAVKGLFGFYPGYFAFMPYYKKVQEYSDFDTRDLWEYQLNLTKDEVRKMMLHIFELNFIYSDYYFFDENCSYQILFLLEAGRPSLNLTNNYPLWVIPSDTVRDIRNIGIIDNIVFRPSKVTSIKHKASLLSQQSIDIALSVINNEIKPESILHEKIPIKQKVILCDLVADYIQYKHDTKKISQQEYLSIFLPILQTRSKLGKPELSTYNITAPIPPEECHKTNRASIGYGFRNTDHFQEIRYRPTYHTLVDSDAGFVKGAQIVFTDIVFRYYPKLQEIKLQKLDGIDIMSLSPRDAFFRSISWKFKTGLQQKNMKDDEEHLIGYLNPGAGFAYKIKYVGILYSFIEIDLDIGKEYDKNTAVALGGSAGILQKVSSFWMIYLNGKYMYYGFNNKNHEYTASLIQQFNVTSNFSTTIEISQITSYDRNNQEGKLYLNYYF